LGQVATEEKSNEIAAIPELLKQIALTDSLITIDAMGCQKEIARDIVNGGGDFVISVKDNQPKLRESIETHFEKHLELDLQELQYRCHETSESAHGRTDERARYLTRIPPDFALKKEWPWVKAIG
jgi:predicted transposase YbfD/YdcC